MKLFIKNMVSSRCILFVKDELTRMGIPYDTVELGVAELPVTLTGNQQGMLRDALMKAGLDLISDKKQVLIERTRNEIIKMIYESDGLPNVNYSCYISEKIGKDYTYLANVFSTMKGTTIQHFIMVNRIERAKEMLLTGELTLTEIAYRLHYSSVAHLSNQFLKITGMRPTSYKQGPDHERTEIDTI